MYPFAKKHKKAFFRSVPFKKENTNALCPQAFPAVHLAVSSSSSSLCAAKHRPAKEYASYQVFSPKKEKKTPIFSCSRFLTAADVPYRACRGASASARRRRLTQSGPGKVILEWGKRNWCGQSQTHTYVVGVPDPPRHRKRRNPGQSKRYVSS